LFSIATVWGPFPQLKIAEKYPPNPHTSIDIKVWQIPNHIVAKINVIVITMSKNFLQTTLIIYK